MVLAYRVAMVPELGTYALLLAGFGLLAALSKRNPTRRR